MKSIHASFSMALLVLCFSGRALFALNRPQSAEKEKHLAVEVYGGALLLNPGDLNLRAAYDRLYLENLREFSNLYAPIPQADDAAGEFHQIRSALPLGFRLKVWLSERWALSLGFKYMKKDQVSNVTAQYQDYGSRPLMVDYSFSPYSISTSGFSPLLGVHYQLWKSSRLDLDLFLTGGPLFAGCRYSIGVKRVYSRNGQISSANETQYEIDGRSTGIALETGIHLKVDVLRNIRVFCEGGYSYQKAKNLKGEGRFDYYLYRDPLTRQLSDQLEWEGYWGIKEAAPLAPLPSNEWDKHDDRVRAFSLDLSGAFLRVGISIAFSL